MKKQKQRGWSKLVSWRVHNVMYPVTDKKYDMLIFIWHEIKMRYLRGIKLVTGTSLVQENNQLLNETTTQLRLVLHRINLSGVHVGHPNFDITLHFRFCQNTNQTQLAYFTPYTDYKSMAQTPLHTCQGETMSWLCSLQKALVCPVASFFPSSPSSRTPLAEFQVSRLPLQPFVFRPHLLTVALATRARHRGLGFRHWSRVT